MIANPSQSDSELPPPPPAKEPLPPVEPPSARFLLQLFVAPMLIVTIIVLVWLLFSWLAHMGSNPQQLVIDLKRMNEASWQKALTLADLLRNPDYDYLKTDSTMANELASVLDEQLEQDASDDQAIKLRMFLARALGEFRVPSVLPVLTQAARQENRLSDVDVRRSAIEALAVYANNNGPDALRENEDVLDVLLASSREGSDSPTDRQLRAELRSASAFALGLVGGKPALDRLEVMTTDSYANARYNAALGLARHGDPRARPILLEMLDTQNEFGAEGEEHEAGAQSKRMLVLKNGIRGAAELAQQAEAGDWSDLEVALQEIVDSNLSLLHPRVRRGIRIQAEDALLVVRE